MKFISGFDEKLVINVLEDDDVGCYTRPMRKYRNIIPLSVTTEGVVINESPTPQSIVIRKTPKFPSRERHMAIRRKKSPPKVTDANTSCSIGDQETANNHDFQLYTPINEDCYCDGKKTCQACKCPRDTHAVYQEQVTSVRERLGFKSEMQTSKIDPRQIGYTWVPPGIMTSAKIRNYFEQIPDDNVPKIGSFGERNRDKQLANQLPKQDLALTYCKHIEPQNRASYEDFVAARNEIALDIGYVKDAAHRTKCANCAERIEQYDLAVIAPKFGDQMIWHPRCFSCSACDELLVDLTYCVYEDKIFCERHYAEMLKPRCNACDEANDRLNPSKGKNVSTDDEIADDTIIALADTHNLLTSNDACIQIAEINVSPSAMPKTSEISINIDETYIDNGNESAKIDKLFSYMENIEKDENQLSDKFEFKEFLDQPKRVRYPSYNVNDSEEERIDEIILNIESSVEIETHYEELQEVYEQFESKKAYVVATTTDPKNDLLLEINVNVKNLEIVNQNVDEGNLENLDKEVDGKDKRNNLFYLKSNVSTETNISELNVDVKDMEIIDIDDVSINSTNRKENDVSIISVEWDDVEKESISTEHSPIKESIFAEQSLLKEHSYNREDSWMSNDSLIDYRRSESSSSGVAEKIEKERELEYIKGRADWQDQSSIEIKEEIDSDDYHHGRRYSETAETLEYIIGRKDWKAFESDKDRSLPKIIEIDDQISIAIKEELDSDEYHHGRRHSEILDLAHRIRNRNGVRFLTQGSARSGRERSPYKVMSPDVNRNEFVERYYWGSEKDLIDLKIHSEVIDNEGDKISQRERLMWKISDSDQEQSSTSEPKMIITVEDTDTDEIFVLHKDEDIASTSESEDERTTVVEVSEQVDSSWEEDFNANEDVIEVVLWDLNSDSVDAESIIFDEFDNPTSSIIDSTHTIIDISEVTDASDNDDNKHFLSSDEDLTKSKMKKSKTIRNLLNTTNVTDVNSKNLDVPTVEQSKDENKNENFISNEIDAIHLENITSTKENSNETKLSNIRDEELNTDKSIEIQNKINNTTNFITNEINAIKSDNTGSFSAGPSTLHLTNSKKKNSVANKSQSKKRKSLKSENIDDLVQEGSMGMWFHK